MIVGNDDRSVAVLYHRDLAKHPCVPLLSEGSQGSHEAPGQRSIWDWQLQTVWYPGALGPFVSKILLGLTTQLLQLVTPPSNGC